MQTGRFRQLEEAIRPPVRKERGKKPPISNSQKSEDQSLSSKMNNYPTPPKIPSKNGRINDAKKKLNYDSICDEKVKIILPQNNFGRREGESPSFRFRDYSSNNKSATTRYSQNENIQADTSDHHESTLFTQKHGQFPDSAIQNNDYSKILNTTLERTFHPVRDSNEESHIAPFSLNRLEPLDKKDEDVFTFESEEIDRKPKATEDLVEFHIPKKVLKAVLVEDHHIPEVPKVTKPSYELIHVRRQSQNMPSEQPYFISPGHRRVFSEKKFEKFFSRRGSEASGQRSHLMAPERSMIEERYCNGSTKSFYHEVLKELDETPLDSKEDYQASFVLNKSDKADQVAFKILETKFSTKHAQAIYHIFRKYAKDNEVVRNKMSYGNFILFMKTFELYNNQVNREVVSLIYTKRCPTKSIDFAAFIDILFKISKYQVPSKEYGTDSNLRFRIYLDQYILNKHFQAQATQLGTKSRRPSVINDEFGAEDIALKLLETNNSLINHIFTLYESFDIQYHNKNILLFKDFKKFCYDYSLVPVLCTLNEATEVFRRFQIGNKPVIDFKGFVLVLTNFATICFEKDIYKGKYNTFPKQLSKFLDILTQMNARVCDQLVANHVGKPRK